MMKMKLKNAGKLKSFEISNTFSIALLIMIFAIFSGFAQQLDDKDITLAVEDALSYEEGVNELLIDVSTLNGVVKLSGLTSNLLSKKKAGEVARTIKGVRSVINDITVKVVDRADEEIRLDIEQAFLSDPAAEVYEIRASVSKAVVTLNGTVQSWQEKQLASEITMSVKGVKGVNNQIIIKYPDERPDLEIKKDVEARLQSDVWVDDFLIDVAVKDGEVSLIGSVGSAQEKRWAMADAWVMGVTNVNADELEVKWWLKDDEKRQDKMVLKTDQEIKDAVFDALIYDPRVEATEVEITVENGIVTLTGMVDNLEAKLSAAEDAANTTGVLRVKNYIRTRPDELFIDEELAERVNEALIRDPYIEIFDIVVTAFNGRVFLHGQVNTLFEKEHAEDVAQRVIGVVDVVNNIEYKPATVSKSDWELKQDINDGLFWNPNIDEGDIFVFVEDGEVTLSGEVTTLNQRMTAEDIAYDAGADWVKNQIDVVGLPQINPEKPTQ